MIAAESEWEWELHFVLYRGVIRKEDNFWNLSTDVQIFIQNWIPWMNINESWILLSSKFCLLASIHECFILACPIILYVYDISLFSISHPLFAVSAILSNCTTARPTTFIGIPIIRRPLFAVSILGSLLPFQFLVLRRGVDERNMLSELENWFLRVYSEIFNWFEESC